MAYGKGVEKVKFRVGDRVVDVYERIIDPRASWNYAGGTGNATPMGP